MFRRHFIQFLRKIVSHEVGSWGEDRPFVNHDKSGLRKGDFGAGEQHSRKKFFADVRRSKPTGDREGICGWVPSLLRSASG
jgi:hypothetical protein